MYEYQSNTRSWPLRAFALLALVLSFVLAMPAAPSTVAAQGTQLAEAIVLVNSNSASYADFQQLIQPYLGHFGVPYTVLDVATTPVTAAIGDYALIVIGHRQIDLTYADLDIPEQGYILDAVQAGSGLVNFDGDIAQGTSGRYIYVNGIFGFGYHAVGTDYGVSFPIMSGDPGTRIDCTDDAHQDPVLVTEPMTATIVVTDGLWTEMAYPYRPVPGVFAGLDEEGSGLPVMHCYASGLPDGDYAVRADLFTGVFGHDLTYYYGYTPGNPKEFSVDTTGRSGGEDRFDEYSLGTVTVTGGTFDIYFQDADERPVPGTAASASALMALYAEDPHVMTATLSYFGWSSVRLVPVGTPPPTMHWISERHDPGEWIGTGGMEMSGIGTVPAFATVVAASSSEPLVIAASSGQGQAVQWASYAWMSHANKGPMYGLDDLVWRSLVWAARKPFAIQGLPPFVTMRVDDSAGPFGWVETANIYGIKPWLGLFYRDVGPLEANHLSTLVTGGMATASVHAKDQNVETTGMFYYDHGSGDLPDATVALNFADATSWHNNAIRPIPISSFVLPQFYEFGTNVFEELGNWNVEFVGTVIEPGNGYPGASWINNGPFRLYESGSIDSGGPLYYADWLEVPGHPELDNQFFDCITEIRDDAGYEWYPNNDVLGSVGRGTRQLKRALDAMALPTLATHEPYLDTITPTNLDAILQGITDNLASYGLIGVTMDDACRYTRAMYTSDIDGASLDAGGDLTIDLVGQSDVQTMLYLFTEQDGQIQQAMVDVPVFDGSTQVIVPGQGSVQIYLPLILR